MVAHFCGFLLRKYDTPTEIPGEQKNLKKKAIKTTPKQKVRALPFMQARWRQNKIGVEQEGAGNVRFANAYLVPPDLFANETL